MQNPHQPETASSTDWDWIIVGSGFGGSVAALRLSEKGYRVLVLEQGSRFHRKDFAKTNWNLRRWLWMPALACRGILRMTFFRHVTVLSGVGVGGGSLVYANTLPQPKNSFFDDPTWSHLANWKEELQPHYKTAEQMLGATKVPFSTPADDALGEIASDLGLSEQHCPVNVGVFFGNGEDDGKMVDDPYFNGAGPPRAACTKCGACMVGCRVGAKNTLDYNYLYIAEKRGTVIQADTKVTKIQQMPDLSFKIEAKQHRKRKLQEFTAKRMVMAGGVLGTLKLLLSMSQRADGLPKLSEQLGKSVRTNSESLTGVQSSQRNVDHSKGLAIGSILHLNETAHVETVRYPAGSGFFRVLMAPHASAKKLGKRLWLVLREFCLHPLTWARAYLVPGWASRTIIMLYMESHSETLHLKLNRRKKLSTSITGKEAPRGHIPLADDLSERMAKKVDGTVGALFSQTLFATPTTAHILGGCAMAENAEGGVIDQHHQVFGHPGLYVIDGSAISANLGVNPSLTIAAMAERAMSHID